METLVWPVASCSRHTFCLYRVVALVARTLSLILLVARWFSTVWFGMISTLLSSFIGVVPLSMLLLKNMGRLGGVGRLLVAALARANLEDSSGASRSNRYCGILEWYLFSGSGSLVSGISAVAGLTTGT